MHRYPQLDGLRAIAAILVVAFHSPLPGFAGGFIGVDVFFVLSGFLITSLLRNEIRKTGGVDYAQFMKRRMLRLYPALVLMLFGYALVLPFLHLPGNIRSEFALSAIYANNFSIAFGAVHGLLTHTWSLAVEFQFYIFWPPVLVALGRANHRQAVMILVVFFLAATMWRIEVYQASGAFRAYFATDTRMSGFILGAIVSLIEWRPGKSVAEILALTALAYLGLSTVIFVHFSGFSLGLGGLLIDFAAAALLLSLTGPSTHVGRILALPILVRVGLWSYGIYLWHYPISRFTREIFNGPVTFAITLILSVILAAASFEIIEPRISKLIDYLRKTLGFARPARRQQTLRIRNRNSAL